MKFPHPLSLLFACIVFAAGLTWVLPAGQYERRQDDAAGRNVVVPGSYRTVEANPIGPVDALVALPRGLADAGSLPSYAAALGMLILHVGVHVPVPSVSGQAVLTMPVLIPVGDLVGIPRQAAVLAYHCGAGLTDIVTPTNGGIIAILAAAGVPFDMWIRFALPRFGMLLALGVVAVTLAIATGF